MLYSPILHGISGAPVVTNADGQSDSFVFADASLGRAAKTSLAKHAQTECFVFSTSGLATDSPLSLSNYTVNTTTPRLVIRWPFNWICTGVRHSCSGRPASGTAAGINIMRNGTSIFSDTTTIASSNVTIATGAGNLYSSIVSPHANHTNWTKEDLIAIYNTAGATGSGNAANNFHATKVYLYGYRR